jgi:hypothetical protein
MMGLRTIAVGIAVTTEQTFDHANASREESPSAKFDCSGAQKAKPTRAGILHETPR